MLQLCDIGKVRRAPFFLFVAIPGAAIPFLLTTNATAAEPKRVLIINSFGTAAPPFTIHSTSFESQLVANIGEGVDLPEVALDMARNDDSALEQAMVEYLERRLAKWKPDLVVPGWVARNGFCSTTTTPIGCFQERRFSPLQAIVCSSFRRARGRKTPPLSDTRSDIPSFFEDMLQVAPATKNIEMVLGATSLERNWRAGLPKGGWPARRPDQVHLLQ